MNSRGVGRLSDMGIDQLEPFLGRWSMRVEAPWAPAEQSGATTSFEWFEGGHFLLQRWQVPHPEAPDGIAVIAEDAARGGYLQHYFDSRGVARLYAMSFGDGIWRLWRTEADFSALDFAQRFTGQFSRDGDTIAGRWENSPDSRSWELDFELYYRRIA
jgi:hypothetical protein